MLNNNKKLKVVGVISLITLTPVMAYYFYTAGQVPATLLLGQQGEQKIESHELFPSDYSEQQNVNVAIEQQTESEDETEQEELSPEKKLSALLDSFRDKINAGPYADQEFDNYKHTASDANIQERFDLINALQANPELIDGVLGEFLTNPASHLGVELSAVLSEIGTPEIQSAALNLGLDPHSGDAESRAMALLLVSDIDEITPDTRDRLLDSYAVETDTELLQFSLMALKPALSTAEDLARVQSTLTQTIQHDNADVRRHALYQQGEWATSNEELSLIRTLAIDETDDNARYRAIGSVADSEFKSVENKQVLTSVVNNESEWSVIRERALESLKSYSLSSSEIANLTSLEERIKEQAKYE